MNRLITPHFALSEFACHDGTPYPDDWIDARLRPLCEILELLRAQVGVPLHIISGYRTERYNRVIRGAAKSQHVQGRAVDITAPGVAVPQLHRAALDLAGRGVGLGGLGRYPGWVHVDTRPGPLARWNGGGLGAEQ